MQIRVDQAKCQGHNRCVSVAPDLFELDDLGYARERGNGDVDSEHEAAARLASLNCPERAVVITGTEEG